MRRPSGERLIRPRHRGFGLHPTRSSLQARSWAGCAWLLPRRRIHGNSPEGTCVEAAGSECQRWRAHPPFASFPPNGSAARTARLLSGGRRAPGSRIAGAVTFFVVVGGGRHPAGVKARLGAADRGCGRALLHRLEAAVHVAMARGRPIRTIWRSTPPHPFPSRGIEETVPNHLTNVGPSVC